MTVKELIKHLLDTTPDADVFVSTDGGTEFPVTHIKQFACDPSLEKKEVIIYLEES